MCSFACGFPEARRKLGLCVGLHSQALLPGAFMELPLLQGFSCIRLHPTVFNRKDKWPKAKAHTNWIKNTLSKLYHVVMVIEDLK